MSGSVYVFGSGDCGQLGLGEDDIEVKKPTQIIYFEDKKIVQVAAGGLHNLALSQDGRVYAWGCNDEKALGHGCAEWTIGEVEFLKEIHNNLGKSNQDLLYRSPDSPFVRIACGDSISGAVTQLGSCWAWGTFRDSKGLLGFSPTALLQEHPFCISSTLPAKTKISKLAAGANHLIALTQDDHQLYAWGCGEQGQLGRRILERHKQLALKPQNVTPRQGRQASPIVDVACGSYHSLALTEDGHLFAWGLNNYGQLGLGDTEPRLTAEKITLCITMTNTKNNSMEVRFRAIAAGEHHSLALAMDGTLYAWGRSDAGQLAIDPKAASFLTESVTVPRQINPAFFDNKEIIEIASGGNHCLARTASDKVNTIYSWGFGEMLQLGNGKEKDEPIPFKLPISFSNILQIDAGGQHSIILANK